MNPLSPEKKVAVLGNGETARRLSEEFLKRGFPVMLVMPNEKNTNEVPEGAEYVAGEELVSVKGQVSDFTLVLGVVGKREERRSDFIVVAYESVREPVYDILGEPHHERIWPLSYLEQLNDDAFGEKYGKIIFLDRLDGVNSVAASARFLNAIVTAQEDHEIACCLITCQVKVASPGLEMLYGRMRDGGCLVARTDLLELEVDAKEVRTRFDDIVLDDVLRVSGDLLVVGERERPAPELKKLAGVLGLETDQEGFLQGDNLLRVPCLTNRRGVLVAGGSVAGLSEWEREQNIPSVVEEVQALSRWLDEVIPVEQIIYDRDRCATCLTCFRVCPHGAILFTDKPHFLHLACQRCGICTSLCPNEAIELSGFEKPSFFERLFPEKIAGEQDKSPGLTGFVCERSVDLVRQYLEENDPVLNAVRWIEVPCAGTLRSQYILETLAKREGADGVVVVSCHKDNCRSGDGTIRAASIVRQVKGLLKTLGMDEGSVEHIPLAPNERERLHREVKRFQTKAKKKSLTERK
jgi:coenzyme F420-reducing hydrogenase delta subunit/Pyruvate/2-oxoacid:ferredoxin oxidoreductase delta subunit